VNRQIGVGIPELTLFVTLNSNMWLKFTGADPEVSVRGRGSGSSREGVGPGEWCPFSGGGMIWRGGCASSEFFWNFSLEKVILVHFTPVF